MLVGAFSILHEKPYAWDSARKQLTYANYKKFVELDGKKLPSHVKIASEKALKCLIEDDLNKLPSFCKAEFNFILKILVVSEIIYLDVMKVKLITDLYEAIWAKTQEYE